MYFKILSEVYIFQLIWVPDTFFVNEKTALFHQATTENQFLRIMHTGDILRSIRLTIKATCPLNLEYFPMDKQMCTLEIESFGYTMSGIVSEDRENMCLLFYISLSFLD